MYFFEVKAHKQRQVLLDVLEDAEAVIDLLQTLDSMRFGGEKGKAATAAQVALQRAKAEALIKADDAEAQAAVKIAEANAVAAVIESQDEQTQNGLNAIKYVLREILTKQYDLVVRVIAKFYGTTPEKLEEENDIFDLVEMALKIAANEKVQLFFRNWHGRNF